MREENYGEEKKVEKITKKSKTGKSKEKVSTTQLEDIDGLP